MSWGYLWNAGYAGAFTLGSCNSAGDGTVRIISDEERAGESTASPRGYLWQLQIAEMTPAEALALLWQAATRDPYQSNVARLVDAKRILERVLERQE